MRANRHIVTSWAAVLLLAVLTPYSARTDSPGSGTTGSVTLTWTLPTMNVDGIPITDLAGAKVYYGTSSFEYTHVIDVGLVNSYTVNGLQPGVTYYFNGTAYNGAGLESDFTAEAIKVAGGPDPAPAIPQAPTGVHRLVQ